MVKVFLAFLLFVNLLSSDEIFIAEDEVAVDPLIEKIQTFINEDIYEKNSAYINILFTPQDDYVNGDKVDDVKVVQTLKDNGLLNLYFKKPSELTLHFKTSGSPLFFMKIMGDTLRNIGYYRYVTKESNLNSSEFTWTIVLTSEYATDPAILQKELAKSGCSVVNVERKLPTEWIYTVDMRDGKLNVTTLKSREQIKLKRSLYAKWLDVSQVEKIRISSSRRNSWYPYIAYYDSSMHLLKVIRIDERRDKVVVNMQNDTHYLKISDIYTLKNIRDDLVLTPMGSR